MLNYIDRDKIVLAGVPVSRDEDGECYVRLSDVRRAIMQVPVVESTADAQEVRRGKWLCHSDCGCTECSNCHRSIEEYIEYPFCMFCGAKMEGDEK